MFGNGNFSWSFKDGVLTICGEGVLPDFSYTIGGLEFNKTPWCFLKDDVVSITICEGIKGINTSNFYDCENLTSIHFPASLSEISTYCRLFIYPEFFERNSKLKTIDVDKENSLYSSIDGVLFNKDKTCLYHYPRGKADKEYVIPNSVKKYNAGSFKNNKHLNTLIILNEVEINKASFHHQPFDNTFVGCDNLEKIYAPKIDLPYSVYSFGKHVPRSITDKNGERYYEHIDNSVYSYNSDYSSKSLCYLSINTKVFIVPDGVTHINTEAFIDARSLERVYLPSSVKFIDSYAFYGCDSLRHFYIENKIPPEIGVCRKPIEYKSLGNIEKCVLHVPKGCKEAYLESEGWDRFEKIIDDYIFTEKVALNRENDKYRINEDFLILLVSRNKLPVLTTIQIKKHFEKEKTIIKNLQAEQGDNVDKFLDVLDSIENKVSNKVFKYCVNLDEPYEEGSVPINTNLVRFIAINGRKNIYAEKESFEKRREEAKQKNSIFNENFDLNSKIRLLKYRIVKNFHILFDAFDIDVAYQEAEKTPGIIAYSHRIGGWSKLRNKWSEIIYNVTENLKIEIRTNFGFGNSSYFYVNLIYKGIRITPYSEWIEYRYKLASDVIRYSKSFAFNERSKYHKEYIKVYIYNEDWISAFNYVKEAGRLSVLDEKGFVQKYIISECENLISGIERFYNESEFSLMDRHVYIETEGAYGYKTHVTKIKLEKVQYNPKGFELIDFKAEKIIGALDFIDDISRCSEIINSEVYVRKLYDAGKKMISHVYEELETQKNNVKSAKKDYKEFLMPFDEEEFITAKNEFIADGYYSSLKEEFKNMSKGRDEIKERLLLYQNNVKKLEKHIDRYRMRTDVEYSDRKEFQKITNEVLTDKNLGLPISSDEETILPDFSKKENNALLAKLRLSIDNQYEKLKKIRRGEDCNFELIVQHYRNNGDDILKRHFGFLISAYHLSTVYKKEMWKDFNIVYQRFFGEELDKKFFIDPTVEIVDVVEEEKGALVTVSGLCYSIIEHKKDIKSVTIKSGLPFWFLEKMKGKHIRGKVEVRYNAVYMDYETIFMKY